MVWLLRRAEEFALSVEEPLFDCSSAIDWSRIDQPELGSADGRYVSLSDFLSQRLRSVRLATSPPAVRALTVKKAARAVLLSSTWPRASGPISMPATCAVNRSP